MEHETLNSIPFLNRNNIEELIQAGFTTVESIQTSTPEILFNKLSSVVDDDYYTLDLCREIIDLAKNIHLRKKKSAFDITNDFFQKNELNDWSDFDKKDALEFLSLHLFRLFDIGLANYNDTNLFLINTSDDIDSLTKKAAFLPSIPTLSFQNNKSIIQIDHQFGRDIETGETGEYQFFCHLPDREESSEWFWAVKPLLQAGIIQYIPNIVVDKELPDGTRRIIDEKYTIYTNEYTISSKEKYLNEVCANSLQISIPIIDDIPLSLFSEITYNETDSFNKFRSFFSKNIRNIDFNKDKEIVDFEESMKEQVNDIQSLISRERKKVQRKHIANVIGTTTIIGATLLVFKEQQQLFDYLIGTGALGVGALGLGLKKLISDSSNYYIEKVNFEGKDCWYLWLLKERGNTFNP